MEYKGCIVLVGQMRGYESCIKPMFSNLFDLNDIDIFISTEENDKCNNLLDKETIIINYNNRVKELCFIDDKIYQKYKYFLNDKLNIFNNTIGYDYCLSIDTFIDFQKKYLLNKHEENTYKLNQNKEGFNYSERELLIYIHIMNGIDLVKSSNKQYDYIIFYRPDIHICSPIYVNKLDLTNNRLYYLNNYMMIFDYNNIYRFDELLTKIIQRPDNNTLSIIKRGKKTDISNQDTKTWYFLVERQFTNFLYEKFNVIFILHMLGHIRYDTINNSTICHKPNLNINW